MSTILYKRTHMKQFSKADLIERILESNDIETKAAATRVLAIIIDTVTERLVAGDQVNISGLCMFKPAIKAARAGTSALTGKPFNSPASKTVRIVAAAPLKAAVK